MNVWKLTAANTLVNTTEDPVPVTGKRRVRVTKVFLTGDDALVYSGARRVKYPRIPGRYAVGVIADENGGIFKKGKRVLLHAFLPEEDGGTVPPDYTQTGPRVCGVNTDGYLRDFVFADENDMTLLPDAVNDEKALLIQHVALAKAAIEALAPHKGDHVAVVGGDMLGLFICQLLIYQQVSPVLIDSRADRIEFAHSCGVYYAYVADDALIENVASVTGGRLVDGAVFTAGVDEQIPYNICARETNIVFCGQSRGNLALDIDSVVGKQLTVHGISDGTDYIETAINLIANKAIDVSSFRMNLMGADKLNDLLREYVRESGRPVNEMNVINLL